MVEEGPAAEMAARTAELFGADVGMATVGVPGPDERDGRPPGTVVIGWSVAGASHAETLNFRADADSLRLKATRAALARLSAALTER
jgi:nicotinamide-nucleotide amidase